MVWRTGNKYENNGVLVARNTEYIDYPYPVCIMTESASWTAVTTEDARKIAAALIAVADEVDAVIEANKSKLPTEPGLYITGRATVDSLWGWRIFHLDADGQWGSQNGSSKVSDEAMESIFKRGGLKRLIPEDE